MPKQSGGQARSGQVMKCRGVNAGGLQAHAYYHSTVVGGSTWRQTPASIYGDKAQWLEDDYRVHMSRRLYLRVLEWGVKRAEEVPKFIFMVICSIGKWVTVMGALSERV